MHHRTSAAARERWHDISVPLAEGITAFPGMPPLERTEVSSRDQGDPANATALRLSTHTGTHVDAPAHFLDGASAVDGIDLDALNGPARVIAVPDVQRIGPEVLGDHEPQRGERLLARRGIAAIGIDYLSIGGEEFDNEETHQTLLGAGIVVLEGLDLGDVAPGRYELRCLPLRVAGGDGAPARALLRAETA